jgi:PKD domain/Thrombospondin type 3 repeat
MRSRLFVLGFMVAALSSQCYAVNNEFLQLMQERWYDTQTLQVSSTVSRGVVTELLNLIDCHNCHKPSIDTIATLSQSWWEWFRIFPGKNFDDVMYSAAATQANQYYCIAYVGNQWYMNGYPRATSPFCSGKFCPQVPISNADVLQTVFNISSKTFYSQYAVNRNAVSDWYVKQTPERQKYFGLQDLGVIQSQKKACSAAANCTIASAQALQTYAKYCTFEPEACGMQEMPKAKKGRRPIAEMNMLLQQGIFTLDELENIDVNASAPGSFVLELFGRLKQRAQCQDINDIDHDGIIDSKDNCYLTYNPQQRDNDADGIGNVCDDDIDNDTIKNPLGVLDDNGNIDPSTFPWFTGKIDNCLTTPNTNQSDVDANNVGDACDVDEKVGIKIDTKPVTRDRFVFVAVYSGSLTGFTWHYGDSTTGPGIVTPHTYAKPGTYTVRIDATTPKGKTVYATTSVTVWPLTVRANLLPDVLVQQVGKQYHYTIATQWLDPKDISYVHLVRNDGRTRQLRGNDITSFNDTYTTAGSYPIHEWCI